jgi:hypothetical protein
MKSAVEVLLAVARIGGQIGIAGDKLRMLLPADCPPELKAAIRQHKPGLIDLLHLNFLIVDSSAINATLFCTPDEATKESLITAGATHGSIYTRSELEQLTRQGVTAEQLPLIHAAKYRFSGRVVNL